MKWFYNSLVTFLNVETGATRRPLSDLDEMADNLQPGDIVLVEGLSRVSNVIRWVTHSPWTHAALYIGTVNEIKNAHLVNTIADYFDGADNEPLLIESRLGQGTVAQPLRFYTGSHLRIARPKGLGKADADSVVSYAISRLGVPYDIRQILDLFRFLLPWFVLPRRWRSSLFKFRSGPSTHTVCSTMVAEAYAQVDFPILPLVREIADGTIRFYRRNPKLCTPSDFDYSPYFEIIKYPLMGDTSQGDYQLLPWRDASELDHEQRGIYINKNTETAL
ncbi:MAG: hypothetical protein HOL98_10380 [Gammaproteobacteria bacterium]|jgi:hypothetical protein|nr:hypothetical protein [Gammaproteobacteria bacterium]MBT5203849.1 hypothetical protein [Gammaproteobacteria bacterium]MBT5601650.1 hypothetical protein [Gammaproteobacteria bacterium]MBT6244641.1 hypothetical protein [Gammaproteobacteria bacterium]